MADGDSTGTPPYKEPDVTRMQEIYAVCDMLNKYLVGHTPADIYKDDVDMVIEMCLNRIPELEGGACCITHFHMDCWQDGFLIGLLVGALGVIRVEVKTDA